MSDFNQSMCVAYIDVKMMFVIVSHKKYELNVLSCVMCVTYVCGARGRVEILIREHFYTMCVSCLWMMEIFLLWNILKVILIGS